MADPVWKRKGFKSQFEYRSYLAQLQGYTGYNAQRVAREVFRNTGDDSLLRGADIAKFTNPGAKTDLEGVAIGKPSAFSFPRTHLYEYDAKVQEIPKGLISRKKFDGRYPKAGTIANRALPQAQKQIDRVFPPSIQLEDPDSFISAAFRAGVRNGLTPGQTVAEVSDFARSSSHWQEMGDLNNYMRNELHGGLSRWSRSARQWDAVASRVSNAKEAKRMEKMKISAWVNDEGSYRMGLAERERLLYDRAVTQAFDRGFFAACQFNGVEYFQVSDGPQCGWTDHNDPDLANGKVVTPEEALANPQAHPFCRRAFFPIRNSGDGKRRHEESKQRAKASVGQVAAAAGGAVAAASLAYLGLTAEITTPIFQGTVGDAALNAIGQGLHRALERMLAVKDRIIATMSKKFSAAGFEQRLQAIAVELSDETGVDVQEVRAQIMAQIHREAAEFEEGNVVSLLTRRVIQTEERALPRVVGDRLNLYEGYYRNTVKNEVLEGVPGADKLAEILSNQDVIHQVLFNSTRFQGKFFRFSLPRINTIDGNTGKRITSRYGRMSLAPNNLFHLHASVKPEGADNALRLITNLKINPNGMVRMGFVKGEDGIIRPNLSFVPKGPLRVYSRANRAGPTVKRVEEAWEWVKRSDGPQYIDEGRLVKFIDSTTGEERQVLNAVRTNIGTALGQQDEMVYALVRREVELPNINKGRVNSITTEVRLITKWVPFSDSMWYKARVNLSALGIKSPEDIKNITVHDWRRWRAEQGNKFDWLSAGVNLRLRGGNLFDFSRSLRIDPTTQYRLRNIEKNADQLFSLFTEGITPSVENQLFEQGMVINPLNGMPLRPSEVAGYLKEQRLRNVPKYGIGDLIETKGRGALSTFVRGRTLDAAELIMDAQVQAAQTASTRGLLEGPGEGSFKNYMLDQYKNMAELYMRTKYLYNEGAALPVLRDELDEFISFMEAQAARGEVNNQSVNILKALAADRKSPWQVAQGYWSMVKKETESRLEQLTDYMITMQRAGVVPQGAQAGPPPAVAARAKPDKALNVQEAIKFIEEGGIDEVVTPTAELYYWDKPDLITAILQTDPKLLAQDVAERLPSLEQVRATLMQDITTKWTQYKSVVPKQIADRIEDRLTGNVLFSEELGSTTETRLNNAGVLRWHRSDIDGVFKPGSARRAGYSLREGFRPGDTLDTSDLGAVRLFDHTPESFKGLAEPPDEVVEFFIDGVSTQRWRGGIPYLTGSYDVTGYSYMSRSGVGSVHPFPDDMPDGVKVVHRIYIKQRGVDVPSYELLGATLDEPVLPAAQQAARAKTLRDAYPQAVDDVVEYLARPQDIADALVRRDSGSRDGMIAMRLKDMIDNAPRLPNNLYRVVMGQDGDDLVEQLTENPVMKEGFGSWLPAMDKFPTGGTGTRRRVVVVLRNPKALNVTPMLEEAPTLQEFITSGAYTFAHRYDDVTKNTTWIFMDYVRRL